MISVNSLQMFNTPIPLDRICEAPSTWIIHVIIMIQTIGGGQGEDRTILLFIGYDGDCK